jgi:hypothetical protein
MKNWAILEMSKTEGLLLVERFETKEQAEEQKDELISLWTHWDQPGCPCQKKFAVLEYVQ